MNRLLSALAFAVVASLPLSVAFGQAALDRAERTVRKQLAQPGAAAGVVQQPVEQPGAQAPRLATRVANPGYLGVISDDRGEQGAGVRVREVIAEGPAATAGLQVGDLITEIDGQPIGRMSDMGKILERSPAGAQLAITVDRGGTSEQMTVTLSKRPDANQSRLPIGRLPDGADTQPTLPSNLAVPGVGSLDPAVANGPKLGVSVDHLSAEAARRFNLQAGTGVVVMSVVIGSAAERAGIPVGSVITAIDAQPVTDPEELGRLIREAGAGNEIEIAFQHRGQEFRRRTSLPGAAGGATDAATSPGLVPVRPTTPGVGSRLSTKAFGEVDDAGPNSATAGSAREPAADQVSAEGDDSAELRIGALERRVRALEARIAQLEAALQQPEAAAGE